MMAVAHTCSWACDFTANDLVSSSSLLASILGSIPQLLSSQIM